MLWTELDASIMLPPFSSLAGRLQKYLDMMLCLFLSLSPTRQKRHEIKGSFC